MNVLYTGLRALLDAPGVPALAGYSLDPARVETETDRDADPEWIDMVLACSHCCSPSATARR